MLYYAEKHCSRTESLEPEHTITFTGNCVATGKEYSVTVPYKNLEKYYHGTLIQDAFPHLSKDDREFLQSGFTKEGWDMMFGEDDECDETQDEETFNEGE